MRKTARSVWWRAGVAIAAGVAVLAACPGAWAALSAPDSVWYGRLRVNGAPPSQGSVLSVQRIDGTVAGSYTFGVDPVQGPGYVIRLPMVEWTEQTAPGGTALVNGDPAEIYFDGHKVSDVTVHAGVITRLDLGLKLAGLSSPASSVPLATKSSGATTQAAGGAGTHATSGGTDANGDRNSGTGLLGQAAGFGVLGATADSVAVLAAAPTAVDGSWCSNRAFFGTNGFVGGDLVLTAPAGMALALQGALTVDGTVFTGGGNVAEEHPQAHLAWARGSGVAAAAAVDRCRQAMQDAVGAAARTAERAATINLGNDLVVHRGETVTLPGIVPGALNVVRLGNLRLQRGAQLVIPGDGSTALIANVTGRLDVGPDAAIKVLGMPAERVLFNIIGQGSPVRLRTGSELNGTLLAVSRNVWIGGDTLVEGAVIGGVNGMHFSPGALVVHRPLAPIDGTGVQP